MKNLILLFIVFLFLRFTLLAQDGWYFQPINHNNDLNEVWAIDENTAVVVGDNGLILKTTNGGADWITKNSDTLYFLSALWFLDNNVGFATGSLGKILRTEDGGDTWFDVSFLPSDYTIVSICFPDNNNGWFLAPYEDSAPLHIYKTTDGGMNWVLQGSIFTSFHIGRSIYFVDEMNGWGVASDGRIERTTNGGVNWEVTSIPGEDFFTVFFIDQNNGWAAGLSHPAGNGTIYKTTDGGVNWLHQAANFDAIFSIFFIDEDIGWAVGDFETILKTTNGGEDWVLQRYYMNSAGLRSVYFFDSNVGWAVGDNGTILHTTNGGVSFVEENEIDEIPTDYSLTQNFPNPFNPSTKIKYSVPQTSNVVIKVFDILGNEIETLLNEEKPAGTYEITWYAENLPSGVYFYRLRVGEFVETKKMVLMK